MKALLSLRFAYRHFRSSFSAMALSMIAVALGVALVVAVRIMNAAVLQGFLDTADATAGRAALVIAGDEGTSFSERLVAQVAVVPGVKLAVPLVRAVTFPNDDSGELLTVHAVDLANDDAVRVYHVQRGPQPVVDDLVEFLNQPNSILLGRRFAESRGFEVGESVDLVTPTGVRQFVIRGLLDPEGTARVLQGRLVVMDVYAAQLIFDMPGQINQIDVVTEPNANSDTVRDSIAPLLPLDVRVEEPEVRRQLLRKGIAAFQMMLSAFSLLAVVAGFVVCFGRLQASFEARAWEMGLLRSVGLRRSVVFRELLKEALLLGCAGLALGIPLGIALGTVALPVLARTTALNFSLPVPSVPRPPIGDAIGLGSLVGLVAAVAAATVPALQLTRTSPVIALSMRGREFPTRRYEWKLSIGAVAAVFVLIAAQGILMLPSLGLVTTGLIVLAAATMAGPIVQNVSRWLRDRSASLDPVTRLVVANLARTPRGTGLMVITLGIGLGTAILFGTLGWSFERSLVSTLTKRYSASLVVTSAFVRGGYENAPLSDGVLSALSEIPGVSESAGERQRQITYQGRPVLLAAYDGPCFPTSRVCNWPLSATADGGMRDVGLGRAMMVSTSFAKQFGLKVGDSITIESPSGPLSLPIAATTPGQPQRDLIVLERLLYKRTWHDDLVSWIHIATTEATPVEDVAQLIRRELGQKYRLRVWTSREMVDHFAAQVREAFSLQYLLEAVTLVLVLVGVGDTLAAALIARRRQLGMMRAIGLHRNQLFRLVMIEGIAIGLFGLLLAIGLGFSLGTFWVRVQFPALLGWTLEHYVPIAFVAATGLAAIVLCMIGALAPSIRAALLSPVAVLRGE
jgi:putative ABC transport system permease protein